MVAGSHTVVQRVNKWDWDFQPLLEQSQRPNIPPPALIMS